MVCQCVWMCIRVHVHIHCETLPTAVKNKEKESKFSLLWQKVELTDHFSCTVCVSVCQYIQLFCMFSLCVILLTGIANGFLCLHWSMSSRSQPILCSVSFKPNMGPCPLPQWTGWLTNLGYADYTDRFILNPTKMAWIRLFVPICVRFKCIHL